MAKTKKQESRRRQKEEEALHGVKRTAATVGRSKADQRRAMLAERAAEAAGRRVQAEHEAALEPDDGADRADAPEEATEAETAMETFDSVATELLSIAVAPKRRPGPAQQAAPDAALPPAAVPADATDADGDVDLVVPAKARPQKRPKKAGAKRAKLQVQRQRAKRVKKKRAVAHAKPRSR